MVQQETVYCLQGSSGSFSCSAISSHPIREGIQKNDSLLLKLYCNCWCKPFLQCSATWPLLFLKAHTQNPGQDRTPVLLGTVHTHSKWAPSFLRELVSHIKVFRNWWIAMYNVSLKSTWNKNSCFKFKLHISQKRIQITHSLRPELILHDYWDKSLWKT